MTTDTAPSSTGTEAPVEDPNNWEEPEDYARRVQLGLRPIFYRNTGEHEHPDRRPCPSWCEIGQFGYEHEVRTRNPMAAGHCSAVYSIVASRYEGATGSTTGHDGETIYGTTPATFDVNLAQTVQATPTIQVYLRHCKGGNAEREHRLTLGVDDAADLVTVLQYLIAHVDADQLLNGPDGRERNAFNLGVDAGAFGLVEPSMTKERAAESGTMPS